MPSKMSTFIKISCFCFIYFFRPRLPWIFHIGSTKNVHINLFISVLMNSKLKMETLHTVGRVLCKMHFNWLRLCVKETERDTERVQCKLFVNALWKCVTLFCLWLRACACLCMPKTIRPKPTSKSKSSCCGFCRAADSIEINRSSSHTRKKQRFSIWLIRETVVVYGFCCCFRCGVYFFLLPENQFSDGNQFRWQPFLIFRWFFRNFEIMLFFVA